MSSRNDVQVLIGGKVYTLSGYESEEYLQTIASYINNKITELNSVPGFKRMGADMQKTLLELNMADDYHKAKKRIAELESEISEKDRTEYDMKHELVSSQVRIENSDKEIEKLKDEIVELQKQIVRLEERNAGRSAR